MVGTIAAIILSGIISGGAGYLTNWFRKDTSKYQVDTQAAIDREQLNLSYEQLSWEKMMFLMQMMQNDRGGNNNALLLLYMMGGLGSATSGSSSSSQNGSGQNTQNNKSSDSTINQPPVNSYAQNPEIISITSSVQNAVQIYNSQRVDYSPAQLGKGYTQVPSGTKQEMISEIYKYNPDIVNRYQVENDIDRFLARKNF